MFTIIRNCLFILLFFIKWCWLALNFWMNLLQNHIKLYKSKRIHVGCVLVLNKIKDEEIGSFFKLQWLIGPICVFWAFFLGNFWYPEQHTAGNLIFVIKQQSYCCRGKPCHNVDCKMSQRHLCDHDIIKLSKKCHRHVSATVTATSKLQNVTATFLWHFAESTLIKLYLGISNSTGTLWKLTRRRPSWQYT
jgi:hypothetical protein